MDVAQLVRLLHGYTITQVLATSVRLGLVSQVAAQPRTLSQLSETTGVASERLEPLLEALRGLGVITYTEAGQYAASAGSDVLDSDRLAGLSLMSGREYYSAWSELEYSVSSGNSGFERKFGTSLWRYLEDNPTVAEQFASTMRVNSGIAYETLRDAYDFPAEAHIVDIGAGDGTLLASILEDRPACTGTAAELPMMIRHVEQTINERGLSARCKCRPLNMFEEIPASGDLYLLKSVLHNWPEADVVEVLDNLHARMEPGSKVVVVERAVPDAWGLNAALSSLTMLVLFGSVERSAEAYRELLSAAGFSASPPVHAGGGLFIVEGRK